ncbi:LysM peptidoglycan-binding domain-containing protein [Mobilitalea sibirica]|uniref:LysM peptidoglycan-binding domain-containing protein n=2 Tax=Mobilitalea sibirica TaxID=1462919 RepID=A0A8J7GX78_9FIRM|nr:LysM peptidoglycan-binding domain-containing protein [Mobilitalea sibirica]
MYCINYVIKQGDTLYSLSRKYNIPVEAIIIANPFVNVYNLRIGEVICIPASVPHENYMGHTTYMVEDGDTLRTVLNKTRINLADLLEYNSLDDIHLEAGTSLEVPIVSGTDYMS